MSGPAGAFARGGAEVSHEALVVAYSDVFDEGESLWEDALEEKRWMIEVVEVKCQKTLRV